MRGLGFGSGYIAQGGDVGSIVSRLLGERFEACKVGSLHSLSPHSSITLIESRSGSCQFFPMARPDGLDMNRLDAFERDCVRRMETAQKWEFGYMNEQATKSERLGSTV